MNAPRFSPTMDALSILQDDYATERASKTETHARALNLALWCGWVSDSDPLADYVKGACDGLTHALYWANHHEMMRSAR